jgi:hypothetical protein
MWTRLAARVRAFFHSPKLDEDFDQEMESRSRMSRGTSLSTEWATAS